MASDDSICWWVIGNDICLIQKSNVAKNNENAEFNCKVDGRELVDATRRTFRRVNIDISQTITEIVRVNQIKQQQRNIHRNSNEISSCFNGLIYVFKGENECLGSNKNICDGEKCSSDEESQWKDNQSNLTVKRHFGHFIHFKKIFWNFQFEIQWRQLLRWVKCSKVT